MEGIVRRSTTEPRTADGLVRGGASVAEPLGSIGSLMTLSDDQRTVGLDINADHAHSVTGGRVSDTARALYLGRSTQVWEIRIVDADDRLVCITRRTMALLQPGGA